MSTVRTAHLNILESSTVSLSLGSADPDFPLARLSDRNIGRPFKAAAAETLEIKADQGGTAPYLSLDMLIIPPGHNLDTMTLDIMHSDDDVLYTPAVSQWVQSGSGLIIKEWASLTKRYWKFIITSPSLAPEFAELFLTSAVSWIKNPSRPAGRLDSLFNVTHAVTASGHDRFLSHGKPKRRLSYSLPAIGESQKDALVALNDSWAGIRPFWVKDHEANWIYGRLTEPLQIKEEGFQRYSANFEFLEVLS
jgi:hypothetical protein